LTTFEQQKPKSKPKSIIREMFGDIISFVKSSDINVKVNGIEVNKKKENDFIDVRISTKKIENTNLDAKQIVN